jgi:tRNA A37 threonylcarbamoyladenosine synthetase subunit TsaC/SUA5/YrdC
MADGRVELGIRVPDEAVCLQIPAMPQHGVLRASATPDAAQ